jgi:hypothetical protein
MIDAQSNAKRLNLTAPLPGFVIVTTPRKTSGFASIDPEKLRPEITSAADAASWISVTPVQPRTKAFSATAQQQRKDRIVITCSA